MANQCNRHNSGWNHSDITANAQRLVARGVNFLVSQSLMGDKKEIVVDLAKAREAVLAQKKDAVKNETDNELKKRIKAAEQELVAAHEPSKSLIDFPSDWKSIVREMIEIYREQEGKRRKKLGFTKLRDRIMEHEDKIENDKRVRDTALTRQDLQNWILYGKVLSNPKFWFVDRFVRKLQISNDQVIDKMHGYVEKRHTDVLSHIFQTQHRAHREKLKKFADVASNKTLISKVLPSDQEAIFRVDHGRGNITDIRQVGIFIKESESSIYGLLLIYPKSPVTIANADQTLRDAIIKHGYLLPEYEDNSGYLSGIIITWAEDEFSSKQRAYSDFQYSNFHIDIRKGCMFIKAGHSADDPLGWSTEVRWKQTRSKFSPFATEFSDDYDDYGTKLTDLSISTDLIKYLKSLKNRYLIW